MPATNAKCLRKGAKRRSNPSIPARRGGLLRFARNDGLGGHADADRARHPGAAEPAIAGRILMGTGRDAADVALTTSFGRMDLVKFFVISDEVVPA